MPRTPRVRVTYQVENRLIRIGRRFALDAHNRAMRHWWLVALVIVAACSSTQNPTFSLTDASVDATYHCPGGASNAAYTIHGTVQARNDTAKDVTVDSATAELVLKSVHGSWLEKVGDRYDAGKIAVSPTIVA